MVFTTERSLSPEINVVESRSSTSDIEQIHPNQINQKMIFTTVPKLVRTEEYQTVKIYHWDITSSSHIATNNATLHQVLLVIKLRHYTQEVSS